MFELNDAFVTEGVGALCGYDRFCEGADTDRASEEFFEAV